MRADDCRVEDLATIVGEADAGANDGLVVGSLEQSHHEAAIDLQHVDGKTIEVCERREARAEIIEREPYTLGP